MRQPRLLICGFGPFPAAPRNPAGLAVEKMAAGGFQPAGVATDFLILPVAWARSPEAAAARLAGSPADGVLLVGVAAEADAFRVETRANSRVAARLDQDGVFHRFPVESPDCEDTLPVTAPAGAMLDALIQAGLPARLSDDAGDYLCNFVLFRLLAARAAPAVGFLHVPQAREFAGRGALSMTQIEQGASVAAAAFARILVEDAESLRI